MRNLWVGVSTPRHRQRAELLAAEEQRVLDDDSRGKVCTMRELPFHANIAGGIDARIGCLQKVIHFHSFALVVFHADRFEVQSFDVWRSACAREDFVHSN